MTRCKHNIQYKPDMEMFSHFSGPLTEGFGREGGGRGCQKVAFRGEREQKLQGYRYWFRSVQIFTFTQIVGQSCKSFSPDCGKLKKMHLKNNRKW